MNIRSMEQLVSLAKNVEFLRRLRKLNGFSGIGDHRSIMEPGGRSPLVEIDRFGSNPGRLQMFSYVPETVQRGCALVVVLHGCGQTAAAYDLGAGWSTLARHYGFALLMPQQQSSNNAHTCFNWFNPEHTTRDRGEAGSIRQMIAYMVRNHDIDPKRIFVTGLSAGGAMTSVMLATYPEVFAGGAIIAGLPYGVASNMPEALQGMQQTRSRPAGELGDLVRKASHHKGPWPRLSVWHGSADRTVNPANADEIVKQWLNVHGLPLAPMSEGIVDGYPHRVWWNAEGETIVESYTITEMAHGTPLGLADNDERYGEQGAFLIEAGISSSYHIANFFGLTAAGLHGEATKEASGTVPQPARSSDVTAKLPPPDASKGAARPAHPQPRPRIDVGAVITRALTAAGLMK